MRHAFRFPDHIKQAVRVHVRQAFTSIDSIAPGAAEGWAGADLSITATISDSDLQIEKAILVQAKLGERLRLAAEAITPLTTWSPIRDEALKKPPPAGYRRSDLKPVRTSSEKSCGCSQAAKCPPRSSWW